MSSKAKFSPAMKSVLGKIDRNTRAVAKLVSAAEYVEDEYGDIGRDLCAGVFGPARFAALQERRNLKAQFEDEFRRLQQ